MAVSLDHLVLTVADIEATCPFYETVLGMERLECGGGRTALHFGSQKFNLHPATEPMRPHAIHPTPGSADLCFLTDTPFPEVVENLKSNGISVSDGPVERTGATGNLLTIYVRDPGGNLIEISNFLSPRRRQLSYHIPRISSGDICKELLAICRASC